MFFQSSQVSFLEFHPVFDSTVLQSIQVNFNTKCKVGVDGEGTGRLSDKIFCTKRILLHIHACMCVSLFFFGDHHEARLTWSGSQFPCFSTKRQQSCHHHTAGLSLCYRLFNRAQKSHRSTSNPTTTIRSFVPEIRITIKSVLCLNCRFSIHHPLSANSAEFLRIEESAPIRQNMCKVKCFLRKWSNIPERCGFTFHFYLLFKRSGSFHPKIPPYSAVPAEIATSIQTPCLGSQ